MLTVERIGSAKELASEIEAGIEALRVRNTPNIRAVRRAYSRKLREAEPGLVLRLARELVARERHRWVAYELVRQHPAAFGALRKTELEALGSGIDSWADVDGFGRILAGPIWLHAQAPDELYYRWARSRDRWWRRAALVSTVALNQESDGGAGDARRTLRVCRALAADRDDMVEKGLSWALRVLALRDAAAVREFLRRHEDVLAARVKREVRNKLRTGLKQPRKRKPT